ncbi:hypothetical protein AB0C81_25240 [Streptomyces roseoverticillatus]|uniref:hypothetical protein n=1 Tax=Streptomyces roseoverticillatus TaxID=66429 RepID=UPI0033F58AD3
MSDEVEEGVQTVLLGLVQEGTDLCRRPHHDGARLLAGLQPPLHPLLGPQQRLGSLPGLQFDMLGRVEGDELLRDGRVQGRPQRRADALPRGRASQLPERLHLGQLGALLGQPRAVRSLRGARPPVLAPRDLLAPRLVLGRDDFVLVGDRVEHLDQVPDVQPVEPQVADARLEVHTDVRRVPVGRRLPDLLRGHPVVEPLAHGDVGGEGLSGAELAPGLFEVGQRRFVGRHLLQQLGYSVLPLGVVGIGQGEQGAHFVEVGLGLVLGVVPAPGERAPLAVGPCRQLLPEGVRAVPLLLQLRAGSAERLARLRVTAMASPVRRTPHSPSPSCDPLEPFRT